MRLLPASHYSIEELTDAFNWIRSDYLVPMTLTPRRLREYVRNYDIDLDSSVVSVDGDRIIGMCMLGVRGSQGWITRLGVAPPARQQRLASTLLAHCLERARQLRIGMVYLEVITGNAPAYRLFEQSGFRDVRRLLILHRPPARSSDIALSEATHMPAGKIGEVWHDHGGALQLAASRRDRPAWTNQTETFRHVADIKALELVDEEGASLGWVSYEQTTLQLQRVILAPAGNTPEIAAEALLRRLHRRFPGLEAVAENVSAASVEAGVLYACRYVDSFQRIEMSLALAGRGANASPAEA